MSSHPFGVEASPGRLYVMGEVDMAVAAVLLDAILCAGLTGEASDLVVDLSQVTFLDSSGMAALVEAHKRLSHEAIQLRIVNPTPMVSKVIAATGLSEYLGVPLVGSA